MPKFELRKPAGRRPITGPPPHLLPFDNSIVTSYLFTILYQKEILMGNPRLGQMFRWCETLKAVNVTKLRSAVRGVKEEEVVDCGESASGDIQVLSRWPL